jgi:hypothetical protein
MKTRIVLPASAHRALQAIYPFRTQELLLKAFCMENNLNDDSLRNRAAASNITITEALRREVVSKHHNIGSAWPEKVRTAKQLAYAKRRTKVAVDNDLRAALVQLGPIVRSVMIPVMAAGRTTNQRIALSVPIGSPG